MRVKPRGLFLTGCDTSVGKTRVGAMIAKSLVAAGYRVGVYKPVASGCRLEGSEIVSDDALALWQAAGRPGELEAVCRRRFLAPVAPSVAARELGETFARDELQAGLRYWTERSDVILVEGVGGWLSPLTDRELVADFAASLYIEWGWPILVVAANRLGSINHTLLTLSAIGHGRGGLPIAGVVLNETQSPDGSDFSRSTNGAEIERWSGAPLLTHVPWEGAAFSPSVDWWKLAEPRSPANDGKGAAPYCPPLG